MQLGLRPILRPAPCFCVGCSVLCLHVQSQSILGGYFELLCSLLGKCVSRGGAAQHACLPALQSLLSSLALTAKVAAEAAKPTKGKTRAAVRLWVSLLDSMLGQALSLHRNLPGMWKTLMPVPGASLSLCPTDLLVLVGGRYDACNGTDCES